MPAFLYVLGNMAVCRMAPTEIGTLAVLKHYDVAMSLRSFAVNFSMDEAAAGDLFWSLKSRGLVDEVGFNIYRINEEGRAMLEAEYNATERGMGNPQQ